MKYLKSKRKTTINKSQKRMSTTAYYQCKVKETSSIPATRKTIRIKFFDSNNIHFSRFCGEIKGLVVLVVIDPKTLISI